MHLEVYLMALVEGACGVFRLVNLRETLPVGKLENSRQTERRPEGSKQHR